MGKPGSATKGTIREKVKEHILQMISEGVYRPGDRIVETKLAKELGISQAPAREAVHDLAMSGLLETRPYYGTYVRETSLDEIEEIYELRALIDQHIGERAAHRITEEQKEELASILEQMHMEQTEAEFARLDDRFHEVIVEAAESPAAKNIWSFLRTGQWIYVTAVLTHPSREALIKQHEQIYRALDEEPENFGKYLYQHIKDFSQDVAKREFFGTSAKSGGKE